MLLNNAPINRPTDDAEDERQSPVAHPVNDRPMQVVVFTSQKGGSGKTTLCGQLAVAAHQNGAGPVALIDTDPQGSLADWWNARPDDTPFFVKTRVERLVEDLEELRMMGLKLVFIDTPPSVTDVIRRIVDEADLVVIPTRPSPHDLRAVGATLDIVDKAGKPLIFAVNGATKRARITGDVAVALSQHGTVAPTTIHHRNDFASSMISGGTVMEKNPKSKSTEEIMQFWSYLAHRLAKLDRPGDNVTFETPGMIARASTEQPSMQAPAAMGHTGFVSSPPVQQAPVKPASGFGRRLGSNHGFGRRGDHPVTEQDQ